MDCYHAVTLIDAIAAIMLLLLNAFLGRFAVRNTALLRLTLLRLTLRCRDRPPPVSRGFLRQARFDSLRGVLGGEMRDDDAILCHPHLSTQHAIAPSYGGANSLL